jgi:hypothetical protein
MKKGLQGAKPDGFNDYILDLLGYEDGDEFVDLFPGTNGMQEAISRASVRGQELQQLEMEA